MLPEATVASGLLQTDLWYLNIYIYVFLFIYVYCVYVYIYIHRERENHICQYLYIPIYHNLSECPRKLWVLTHYPWNLTSWILPPSASWLLLGGSQATLWSDPNPDIGKVAHQNITKLHGFQNSILLRWWIAIGFSPCSQTSIFRSNRQASVMSVKTWFKSTNVSSRVAKC